MSTGNEGGAEQDTETYDSVVEDLNFDPEIPDVQPHPDHAGPGAHASARDDGEAHTGEGPQEEGQ
ncbi:hypothetical protein GCM10023350_41850 [Nocardioides endophyticus]|uniref:Uncharacterized protein n=1 Tax=Nocardioides endophyticus TaxID=1353775 RepID=A0ABP8ZCS6_9ACTN